MGKLILTVLMVGLLLGAGAMSHGQDRVPVLMDDPTKGREFRNKVNREKLAEALRERRDVRVQLIIAAGDDYSLPELFRALRERGKRGEAVAVTYSAGTAGFSEHTNRAEGAVVIRGNREGTAQLIHEFKYGRDEKKPFTVTIDFTFTKKRQSARKP